MQAERGFDQFRHGATLTGSLALEFGHDGVVNVERRLHMVICIIRMAIWQALNVIVRPEEMDVPGFDFHSLRGFKPTRYSVHVNGPWWITFEFEDERPRRVGAQEWGWVSWISGIVGGIDHLHVCRSPTPGQFSEQVLPQPAQRTKRDQLKWRFARNYSVLRSGSTCSAETLTASVICSGAEIYK